MTVALHGLLAGLASKKGIWTRHIDYKRYKEKQDVTL